MFDRASEYYAHYTVTFVILIVGSIIGAVMLMWPCAYLAMHFFGNQTEFLTDSEMFAAYGVLSLLIVHLVTRGWWFNKSMAYVQEMEELHKHQLSRMSRE
ncbi:hypothetical protein [Comamonas thiooxydans]|uniref:hypothetical protein n=1 Tax=Comamonas thiooxydans TaxID=363952 RepID=UPI000B411C80|nr:hypothetical protein [Comamonas thiooxydans]